MRQNDIGAVVLVSKDIVVALEADRTQNLCSLFTLLRSTEPRSLQGRLNRSKGTLYDIAHTGLSGFDQQAALNGLGCFVVLDTGKRIQDNQGNSGHQHGNQYQSQQFALES